jgi:hypothetical protein
MVLAFQEKFPMSDDKEVDLTASRTPEADAKLEADETAELKRELTDDEIARIAGGVAGSNQTHTQQPV